MHHLPKILTSTSGIFAVFCLIYSLLGPAPIHAGLFDLEPGDRIKGHQALKCDDCHTSGSGVSRQKCLSCHTHQPMAARILSQQRPPCARCILKSIANECHQEHQGKNLTPSPGPWWVLKNDLNTNARAMFLRVNTSPSTAQSVTPKNMNHHKELRISDCPPTVSAATKTFIASKKRNQPWSNALPVTMMPCPSTVPEG